MIEHLSWFGIANDALKPGLTFEQILILLVIAFIGTIALKFTFNFDINKYIESRKEQKLQQLKNACTHHKVIKHGEEYGLQSLFVSPPGTVQWQCQRCGIAKYFVDGELDNMTNYYLNNFEEYTKLEKKFKKLLKKSKLIS